jgi:predicted small secreted protein
MSDSGANCQRHNCINDLRLAYNSFKLTKPIKIPEPPPLNIKEFIDMILLSPDSREIIISIKENNNLGDKVIKYIKEQSKKNNNIEVYNIFTQQQGGSKKKNKHHQRRAKLATTKSSFGNQSKPTYNVMLFALIGTLISVSLISR